MLSMVGASLTWRTLADAGGLLARILCRYLCPHHTLPLADASLCLQFVTETTTTIDNLGEKLACCADGKMPAASEELVELDRAAHTLKGSAMTMGIPCVPLSDCSNAPDSTLHFRSIVEPSMGLREGIAAALPSDIQRSLAELTAAWGRAKPVLVGLVSLMERRSELEAQVV
jgi:Hpt domain